MFVTAIINGLVAPTLMALVVLLSSTRAVMGKQTSGWVRNTLTWSATVTIGVAASALIVRLVIAWR